jgi:DNA-binding transcriptional LysR family regulator
VALAHENHFARAAERCELSQPAVSLAVKQLETELGVAIVQRGNRFRGYTHEGEIVLKWARRMLIDEDTLKQELRPRGYRSITTLLARVLDAGAFCEAPKLKLAITAGIGSDHVISNP